MFIDFVFPKDDEKDFVEMAERIGTKAICFVYPKMLTKDVVLNLKALSLKTKVKLYTAVEMVPTSNKKLKPVPDFIFLKTNDPVITRKIIEQKKADIVFGMEFHFRKDYMHQLDSGLNHILVKIAQDKNITFGFSLLQYNSLDKRQKSRVLARLLQNVKLYNKYQLKLKIFSGADSSYGLVPEDEIKALNKVLRYEENNKVSSG